jgi:hypothetical protein
MLDQLCSLHKERINPQNNRPQEHPGSYIIRSTKFLQRLMKLLQQPISSLDISRITRQQEQIDQKVSAQDELRSGNCIALVTCFRGTRLIGKLTSPPEAR